jgi:hypothetical protein
MVYIQFGVGITFLFFFIKTEWVNNIQKHPSSPQRTSRRNNVRSKPPHEICNSSWKRNFSNEFPQIVLKRG